MWLKVTDVKMISDKNSRRPKGIAYVEFRELESVHKVSHAVTVISVTYKHGLIVLSTRL